MEQRAFVAVALMAAVLILYQAFLVPHEVVAPPQKPAEQATKEAAPTPAPAPSAVPPLPAPVAPTEPRPPQRVTRVTTPLYEAGVSSEGGKLQEFVLRYRGEKPMVAVGDLGPTGLVIAPSPGGPAQVLPMQASLESVSLGTGAGQQGSGHDRECRWSSCA